MSIACMNRVWKESDQGGSGLLVLLAIADYADDQGRAFPSVETLAKKTRLSERQVQRWIRTLEETGDLTVEYCAGPGLSNLYTVNFPDSAGGDKMTPPVSTGCHGRHPTGDVSDTRGVTPATPKPSGNHQRTLRRGSFRKSGYRMPSGTVLDSVFDAVTDDTLREPHRLMAWHQWVCTADPSSPVSETPESRLETLAVAEYCLTHANHPAAMFAAIVGGSVRSRAKWEAERESAREAALDKLMSRNARHLLHGEAIAN